MEKYLKEIAENTKPQSSFQIVLNGENSSLKSTFEPPLAAGCKYKIALVSRMIPMAGLLNCQTGSIVLLLGSTGCII